MPALRTQDFDFTLPEEQIAQHPAGRRDASRLMLLEEGGPRHHGFAELPELIDRHVGRGALLVVNDTQVIPARLLGRRWREGQDSPGGRVELLLIEPLAGAQGGPGWRETWRAMYRASKPLRPGDRVLIDGSEPPAVTVIENEGGGHVRIDLSGSGAEGLLATLDRVGQVPLPPYIRRPRPQDACEGAPAGEDGSAPEGGGGPETDRLRYQTVYARAPGAVAAPTAGLHFTTEVLAALAARGIEHAAVTLHVGLGTFAPIKTDDPAQHVMHRERYHVSAETAARIAAARAAGRPVLAVGTTVVRTLESATPAGEAAPRPGWGETRIFIYPPYTFRAVSALLTNFHLPRSTLLMLVSAFAGRRRVLAAYAAAVAAGYRFFSYGDAMLIPRQMSDS